MPYDQQLANRVRAMLSARDDVEEKPMFGGLAFMVRGHMACGIVAHDLMVRVGAERYVDALAQPHVRAMDFTHRPMTGMIYVGSAGVKSDGELRKWVDRGTSMVAGLPAKSDAKPKAAGKKPAAKTKAAAEAKAEPAAKKKSAASKAKPAAKTKSTAKTKAKPAAKTKSAAKAKPAAKTKKAAASKAKPAAKTKKAAASKAKPAAKTKKAAKTKAKPAAKKKATRARR